MMQDHISARELPGSSAQDALLIRAQLTEARLLLRFAAASLNETERLAVGAFMLDVSATDAAQQHGGITRGGVWMAQQSGFAKMRRFLEVLGIERVGQVL